MEKMLDFTKKFGAGDTTIYNLIDSAGVSNYMVSWHHPSQKYNFGFWKVTFADIDFSTVKTEVAYDMFQLSKVEGKTLLVCFQQSEFRLWSF